MDLPKNWADLTISNYLKLYTVTRMVKEPLDLQMNILASLGGCSVKEIEKLKVSEIISLMKELDWLSELPKDERIPVLFKLDGQIFKPTIFHKDMTGAQFIDYSSICKDVPREDLIYHMHELLACFCVKEKYDGYVETAENFYEKMTMDVAYPYYVFFCNVLTNLSPAMENYLKEQTDKQMKEVKKIMQEA